jgi:hypothetical protein
MEKYIQQRSRASQSAAWLGLMETGSILIKGKRKHFQNVRQGVSNVFGVQALKV